VTDQQTQKLCFSFGNHQLLAKAQHLYQHQSMTFHATLNAAQVNISMLPTKSVSTVTQDHTIMEVFIR
jgi:hypothetical protein